MLTSAMFRVPTILALMACHLANDLVAGAASPSAAASRGVPTREKTPSNQQKLASKASHASRSLASTIGADCKNADEGLACTIGELTSGDFYDIELLSDCDSTGFFAGVVAAEADLLDTLPVTGSRTAVRARVSTGQFLCILATARSGQAPAYFYVAPMSPADLENCQAQSTCNRYRSQRTTPGGNPIARACAVGQDAGRDSECPHGWIRAGQVEAFSNGLESGSVD